MRNGGAFEGGLVIDRVEPSEISIGLTRELQRTGFEAWSRELPTRTPEEIGKLFNPQDENHLAIKQHQYRLAAEKGSLVVARCADTVAAYGLVLPDVSGNKLKRWAVPRFKPKSVYAWAKNISVGDEFSERATEITAKVARTAFMDFDLDQPSTTYIFNEDLTSREFYDKLGYTRSHPNNPKVTYGYFGELKPDGSQNEPTTEYRYQALSVGKVVMNIEALLQSL